MLVNHGDSWFVRGHSINNEDFWSVKSHSACVSTDWIDYWIMPSGGTRPPCFMNSLARILAFLAMSCFSYSCMSSKDYEENL